MWGCWSFTEYCSILKSFPAKYSRNPEISFKDLIQLNNLNNQVHRLFLPLRQLKLLIRNTVLYSQINYLKNPKKGWDRHHPNPHPPPHYPPHVQGHQHLLHVDYRWRWELSGVWQVLPSYPSYLPQFGEKLVQREIVKIQIWRWKNKRKSMAEIQTLN